MVLLAIDWSAIGVKAAQFILSFSILVILHELGHFLAAKRLGIPIARFSVGLGPKVWGFKTGETEYWLSLIPCGGYVMPALIDEEAFDKIPLMSRILFLLGGPAANILGAFLCLSLMNIVKLGFSVNSAIYLPLDGVTHPNIPWATRARSRGVRYNVRPANKTQPPTVRGISSLRKGW